MPTDYRKDDMNTVQEVAHNLRYLASESCDHEHELLELADQLEAAYYVKGTIVKAIKGQDRFKSTSLWISLGNGKYQHLTGEKGLVTTHSRLDGYVKPVWVS
jgi:hypothetical protein